MKVILLLIMIISITLFLWSNFAQEVRDVIAYSKKEFDYRIDSASYEEIEQLVLEAYQSRGLTKEIFAKYWQREVAQNPRALPVDAYHSIIEELDENNNPDPEIWNNSSL